MFIRTVSISLLGLVAATLFAQVPKPEDLPKLAEDVVKEREFASKDSEVRAATGTLSGPDTSPFIAGDTELIYAYAMSPVRPSGADIELYRKEVIKLFRSSEPKMVGLACQIAGLSGDFDFLPQLGALIEDKRPSLVCQLKLMSQVTMPNAKPVYQVPTVQQLALAAIANITYLQFSDKSQFDLWYKDFPNRTKRIWYWRATWQNRQGVPFWRLSSKKLIGRLPVVDEPFFCTDTEFQKLDRKTSLNVLMGFQGYEAIDHETSELIDQAKQSTGRFSVVGTVSGTGMMMPKDAIINYIEKRNLKQNLIALFEKPDPAKTLGGYPIASVIQAISLYSNFADKGDLKRFAKLQEKWRGNQPVSEQVAIVRSKVDPDNGYRILSDVFTSFPKSQSIAEKLAERYFASSIVQILEYYHGLDKWEVSSFCRHIKDISEKGTKVPIGFFTEVLSRNIDPNEAFPSSSLADLASAFNTSLAKEAISTNLIRAATYFNGKVAKKTLDEKNSGHGEAVVKLKEAMLAALATEKIN